VPGLVKTATKIKLILLRLPPGSKDLSHPTFVSPSLSSPTEGILTRLKNAFSASLYLRPPLYQYRRRRLWRMSASSSSLKVSGLAEKRTLDVRLVPSFILLSMAGTVSFWITCVSESLISSQVYSQLISVKVQYTPSTMLYLLLWERYVINHLLRDSFSSQWIPPIVTSWLPQFQLLQSLVFAETRMLLKSGANCHLNLHSGGHERTSLGL